MIVGIEVGGTFTDLVMVDAEGRLTVHKLPSTPADPSVAAINGLTELLAKAEAQPAEVRELLHGSTIAANALIQRRGAKTVLLTTAGFRDVLFIQRQDKTTVYDMFYQKPEPLISRAQAFEVPERMGPRGNVKVALDHVATAELVDRIMAEHGPDSIAVCFLHAYANPVHERAVGALIADRYPGVRVSLSSEVSAEHREYERTSTTVIDAYIGPAVERYLSRFGERATEVGICSTPLIMQSNGGVVPLDIARKRAANMFVSGPAAAVTAAAEIARQEDLLDLISIDIGGTSCDVCLVSGGVAQTTIKGTSEHNVDGLPLNIVMTDIVTIGAGGGSIARVDEGGMLQVGPDSAGADPGPACYDKGGREFTLTDAMMLLGLLDPTVALPGDITLRPARAVEAATALGAQFDLTAEALAARVYRIAIANMAQAVRRVSVQRGFDPRRYALLPCGGAGPLIAAALATEVGMDQILLPPHPGIFSALGLSVADVRIDYVRAVGVVGLSDLDVAALQAVVASLAAEAAAEFSELGHDLSQLRLNFSVDARYAGQGFELRVPFQQGAVDAGPEDLVARFHDLHSQQYGHSFPASRVEAISFRLSARYPRGHLAAPVRRGAEPTPGPVRTVKLPDGEGQYATFKRDELPEGFSGEGPAIITEATTSFPVPPGWAFRVSPSGAIVVKRKKK